MKQADNLEGKVVVITGASSGAGRAAAIEFAKERACLVLAARRANVLEEVAEECSQFGAEVHVMKTDTRDSYEVHELVKQTMLLKSRIDVWINNAGVLAAGELEVIPADVNENVIRTNLIGYINGAHAVLPIFKLQEYGILINNISVGGWFPTPFMSAYCASKFGLQGFSEALKGELKDHKHIHVCDLYPPFLDTPGLQHSANYTSRELTPAPPVYDPREVAKTMVALAKKPKSISTVGVFPMFLKWSYKYLPVLSRNITSALIKKYLQKADKTEYTNGNVLNPVAFGTGIDGGWRTIGLKPGPLKQYLFFATLAATLLLVNNKHPLLPLIKKQLS